MQHPTRPKRCLIAWVLALGAFTAAGCGSSADTGTSPTTGQVQGRSAREILAQARKVAFAARSVRLKGSISGPSGPIKVDVGIAADTGAAGRVTVHGNMVRFVEVGGRAYVEAPASAYSGLAPPGQAAALAGRWLRLPAKSPALAQLRDASSLDAILENALTPHGAVYVAGSAEIGGHRAIRLRDSRGGSLYVAAVGAPYPLAIQPARGGSKLELGDWNEPVRITAPPASSEPGRAAGAPTP